MTHKKFYVNIIKKEEKPKRFRHEISNHLML